MRTIILHDEIAGIPFEIRKMRQAKRMTLRVSGEGRVWVSMPHGASVAGARSFVKSQQQFVHRALNDVKERKTANVGDSAQLELPVEGEWFVAAIVDASAAGVTIDREAKRIMIAMPAEEDRDLQRRRSIVYWQNAMIERANSILPERTLELARELREPLRRVAIRDQKTRWGSCSKRNRSINLNWRVVLFPDDVRDYLILHELAHLHHADHSRRFWELVEQWCPWYRQAERWIDDHGPRIMDVTAQM